MQGGAQQVQIVSRTPGQKGFAVLPRRWVIEVVFTQMTKSDVLALGAGGQHVPDLDVGVGDDHAADQQQHKLPALLEVGLVQSALEARAERFRRRCHAGELLLAGRVTAERFCCKECRRLQAAATGSEVRRRPGTARR